MKTIGGDMKAEPWLVPVLVLLAVFFHKCFAKLDGKESKGNNDEKATQYDFSSPQGMNAKTAEKLLLMEKEYDEALLNADAISWIRRYENMEDFVIAIISEHGLSVVNRKMEKDDWDLVLKVMIKCPYVKYFSFCYGLDSLMQAIKEIDAKDMNVKSLHYTGRLGANGITQFMKFANWSSSRVLIFESSGFNKDTFSELEKQLQKLKYEKRDDFKIEIRRMDGIPEKGLACLAKIPRVSTEVHVAMNNCNLDDQSLRTFKTKLGNSKLKGIDISNNHKITEEGFKTFGEIVQSSEVSIVDMSNCKLNEKKLEEFVKAAGNSKISSLNLSSNRSLGKSNFRSINSAVSNLQVKSLNLADCSIKTCGLKHSVDFLDVSYNGNLQSIEKIVKKASNQFHACNCMLLTSDLKKLSKSLKSMERKRKRKLEDLRLSETYKLIDGSMILFVAEEFENTTKRVTIYCPGVHRVNLAALKRKLYKLKDMKLAISPCMNLVSSSAKEDIEM